MEKIVITKLRGKPKDWDYRVNGKKRQEPSIFLGFVSSLASDAFHKMREPLDFNRLLDNVLMWSICFTAVHMLYIYIGR